MKKSLLIISLLFLTFSVAGILADSNETLNQTNQTLDNATLTNGTVSVSPGIILTNFMPQEVKVGDVQFNIQIQNNMNETINNTFALVTGEGFSTYNIVPINSLAPGEKDYIFVYGNLKEEGNVTLTINIDNNIFYQNISVISDTSDQQKLDEIQQEQENEQEIQNISNQLNSLKQNFSSIQNEFVNKQSDNYDVSMVNFDALSGYIHNVQADILTGNLNDAKVNLDLAYDEYNTQKGNLDNSQKVPLISILKNNVVLFSTFAGAVLTFFALYELLKKKKNEVAEISKKIVEKKNK